MSSVALNIRQDADSWELGKGEGFVYRREDGSDGLGFGCPRCGYVASGGHRYANRSLTPSIVCAKDGCGYHGWLRDGVFTEV